MAAIKRIFKNKRNQRIKRNYRACELKASADFRHSLRASADCYNAKTHIHKTLSNLNFKKPKNINLLKQSLTTNGKITIIK